ncbi:RNA polymerase sigma factor [Candidatus Microgenomates bacterium]|nr:RNA polymerase sigma factor [Candidatus Microgenomates bacterium]
MLPEDDKVLIDRLLKRDEQALYEFFKAHEVPLSRFIQRQVSDPHEVEELTQEVFIDFIESLRNFRGDAKVKTFLFSIARHKIIDYIRRKKIKKIVFSKLPPKVVEGLQSIIIDDDIDKKELQEKIAHVFAKLPNDYKVILRLKYIENRKMKEIAASFSLSFKAAESLLYRARRAFVTTYEHYTLVSEIT